MQDSDEEVKDDGYNRSRQSGLPFSPNSQFGKVGKAGGLGEVHLSQTYPYVDSNRGEDDAEVLDEDEECAAVPCLYDDRNRFQVKWLICDECEGHFA